MALPLEPVIECCRRCIDSWCERRELRCLAYLLPTFVGPLVHTDQLHDLLSALKDVKGMCRDRLTKEELGWILEAHNALEDLLAVV